MSLRKREPLEPTFIKSRARKCHSCTSSVCPVGVNKAMGMAVSNEEYRKLREQVIENSYLLSYPAGATIQRAGDTIEYLYFISQGSVSAYLPSVEGDMTPEHIAISGYIGGMNDMLQHMESLDHDYDRVRLNEYPKYTHSLTANSSNVIVYRFPVHNLMNNKHLWRSIVRNERTRQPSHTFNYQAITHDFSFAQDRLLACLEIVKKYAGPDFDGVFFLEYWHLALFSGSKYGSTKNLMSKMQKNGAVEVIPKKDLYGRKGLQFRDL